MSDERIAGLRWGEAAARAVLRTAFSVFGVLFADEGIRGIYLRRLRGARFRREPPKITPLRGEVVRAAACYTLFADGGRNATAVRRGGAAANCTTLTSRILSFFFIRYLLFGQKVT